MSKLSLEAKHVTLATFYSRLAKSWEWWNFEQIRAWE